MHIACLPVDGSGLDQQRAVKSVNSMSPCHGYGGCVCHMSIVLVILSSSNLSRLSPGPGNHAWAVSVLLISFCRFRMWLSYKTRGFSFRHGTFKRVRCSPQETCSMPEPSTRRYMQKQSNSKKWTLEVEAWSTARARKVAKAVERERLLMRTLLKEPARPWLEQLQPHRL